MRAVLCTRRERRVCDVRVRAVPGALHVHVARLTLLHEHPTMPFDVRVRGRASFRARLWCAACRVRHADSRSGAAATTFLHAVLIGDLDVP